MTLCSLPIDSLVYSASLSSNQPTKTSLVEIVGNLFINKAYM